MYRYSQRTSMFKKIILIFLLIVTVSVVSIYIYKIYASTEIESYTNYESENIIDSTEQEESENELTEILENVNKTIVGISKIKTIGESIFEENSTEKMGLGTGIVISENGYIITNWHVAGEKYSECYITLENSKTYKGTVEWVDTDLDLAIIKIDAANLDYLKLGDSNNISIGEDVYAIGNPVGFEFQRTVTHGIISGLNRTVKIKENDKETYMENLIQTDATINPGNSGGPLINEKGEVIGINTIKIESAEGMGFAVPINTIKPIIESFIENRKI